MDVTEEQFYRMVNRSQPSLIRTEADELTYCLHIMVRYELEKQMFAGTITAHDLPAAWNRLYKEYLGVDVPSDREGVLRTPTGPTATSATSLLCHRFRLRRPVPAGDAEGSGRGGRCSLRQAHRHQPLVGGEDLEVRLHEGPRGPL